MSFTLEAAPERKENALLEEDSVHPARVVRADLVTITPKDKKKDPFQKVKFGFELQGPDYVYQYEGEDRQKWVYGDISAVFNDGPYCKLRSWVTEILSADELPEGFTFDLEDLIGNEVQVIVEIDSWLDRKAPRSAWELDLNDVAQPPKRFANKVKDVVRASANITPAAPVKSNVITMDDVADEFGDEPF